MRLLLSLILSLASFAQADENDWRVPFITTPGDVVERMLELAGTKADDLVADLGSGDGRIVIGAAKKFGARGLGIELDAKLVDLSRENARKAGVADRVAFVQGDVLEADAHLQIAMEADPDWGPLVDRVAWYASDRGDASLGRLAMRRFLSEP